jgi:hypothetical protein
VWQGRTIRRLVRRRTACATTRPTQHQPRANNGTKKLFCDTRHLFLCLSCALHIVLFCFVTRDTFFCDSRRAQYTHTHTHALGAQYTHTHTHAFSLFDMKLGAPNDTLSLSRRAVLRDFRLELLAEFANRSTGSALFRFPRPSQRHLGTSGATSQRLVGAWTRGFVFV